MNKLENNEWEYIIKNEDEREKWEYTDVDLDSQTKHSLKLIDLLAEEDFHYKFRNNVNYSSKNLDRFFASWSAIGFVKMDRNLPNDELVFALALTFGSYMIKTHNFVWKDKSDGKQHDLILWYSDEFVIEMSPLSYIHKAIHDHKTNIFSCIEEHFLIYKKMNL